MPKRKKRLLVFMVLAGLAILALTAKAAPQKPVIGRVTGAECNGRAWKTSRIHSLQAVRERNLS